MTTLYLAKFLSNNKFDSIIMVALDIWTKSDFMCNNHILNKLDNTQCNVHSLIKSAKALWKALNKKFKIGVVVMKKFIIDKFLDFKMVHSMIIMSHSIVSTHLA